MAYTSIVAMAASPSLQSRITAAAAKHGAESPIQWSRDNVWQVVSSDVAWETAWDGALRQLDNPKFNPDTGARNDVITDVMLDTAVVARMAELSAPA